MEIREQTVHISAGTIVKIIVVTLIFALLFVLKDILLVVLMSVVIASAVEPGTLWFKKRGVARLFSVILIYLLIAVALVGIVFFLLIPLLSESADFLRNFPTYFNENTFNSFGESNFLSTGSIFEGLKNSVDIDEVINQINVIIAGITSNTFGTVATFFGGIISFLLTIILSFYLSVEEDGVGKFLKAVTPLKHEKYVIALWGRSQRKIGLWMQGQLVLAIIIGMLVYLGLLIIGVPNALLLACLAAAFEIIPLFGPILASIPAIAISFVAGGLPLALLVVGLYIIVHQFENQLIYPLVVKKVIGLSPVVSIVALAAGWELAGVVGLLLAVPIASVITEFISDLEKDKIEKIERMANNVIK